MAYYVWSEASTSPSTASSPVRCYTWYEHVCTMKTCSLADPCTGCPHPSTRRHTLRGRGIPHAAHADPGVVLELLADAADGAADTRSARGILRRYQQAIRAQGRLSGQPHAARDCFAAGSYTQPGADTASSRFSTTGRLCGSLQSPLDAARGTCVGELRLWDAGSPVKGWTRAAALSARTAAYAIHHSGDGSGLSLEPIANHPVSARKASLNAPSWYSRIHAEHIPQQF